MKCFLLFWLLLVLNSDAIADSTFVQQRVLANTSCSFLSSANWNGSSNKSLSLSCGMDFYRSHADDHSMSFHSGKFELGFTRYLDSLWQKHADLIRWQSFWKKQLLNHTYTLSVLANTRLLRTDLYYYDYDEKVTKRKWNGSFFNPFDLEAGYGLSIAFWQRSVVNFSFATVRIHVEPINSFHPRNEQSSFARLKRSFLFLDYGCSGQAYLFRNWNQSKVEWIGDARFFLNGFDRDRVNFDLGNKLVFKLWKYLQLRLDSKVVYDSYFSYHLQFRNELLIGIFYDSKNQ